MDQGSQVLSANHWHRRKATVGVLAALAAVLVTAGCSSSSSSASSPAATSSGAASSAASTASGVDPQVAALVPAAVKDKGSVTVAVDATYPPDEFVASDGKTITGMDADLAAALGTVMGVKLNLVTASFDSIIPGLQSARYDIGLSSFTQTLARQKVVDFVTYFQAGEAFYVKSGAPAAYTTKASLCGATVAVEKGTTEQDEATAQAADCAKTGKNLTVSVFGDQNSANLAVSSGRANVGYADSQVAGYIVKQSNGQFQLSGPPFEVAPYGIAFPKGSGLTNAVQAAVKALIANGTYGKILDKWGLTSGGVTASQVTINSATS
jgi:polar amino acid transport system substrate-binding protein